MAKRRPGSIKRFGARYGRGVKLKFGQVEAEQRKNHLCPYCRAIRVKRVATGIWECRKCGAKFTGRAYSVGTRRKKVVGEEEPIEAKKEEKPAEPVPEVETPAPEAQEPEEPVAEVETPVPETTEPEEPAAPES